MKKKLLTSLLLLSIATTIVSYPIYSYGAEESTEEAAVSEEGAEGEEGTEEVETDENGEPIETTTEPETTAPDLSYFAMVTNPEGAKFYQEPKDDSAYSINIPIPQNTVLHILEDARDPNGVLWGYTVYADLKEGYVKLVDLSHIQAKTAAQMVQDKFNGNWGEGFVKVDGKGSPVTFNAISPEELAEAEESNANDTGGNKYDEDTGEITAVVGETNEDGSPVIDVTMNTDEAGNVIETESEEESSEEAEEKKSGGFSIFSFLIGFFTVILLEGLVAGIMILLKVLKKKKKAKAEAAAEAGGAPEAEGEGDGKKKKKGFKLPLPKIKIKLPKPKLPFGKKKKKKEESEE